eukprot:scaffold96834_cov33-Phaeocystis_antarctica.AAC.1
MLTLTHALGSQAGPVRSSSPRASRIAARSSAQSSPAQRDIAGACTLVCLCGAYTRYYAAHRRKLQNALQGGRCMVYALTVCEW